MIGPRFIDLFAWEWRRAGRQPLLWVVLAILAAGFVWGASNTATLHRAQSAAMARAVEADRAWTRDMRALAVAFREPARPGAAQVAYWQDPTNVAGYSEYFVRGIATKPHLPLSPLSAGVSDLAPSRLDIRLNTLFGFADTYDFENPRGLALGRFDLGFALAILLPVALLLLFALLGTFERDRGMLRLVAAQATPPRRWIAARVAAIMAWTAPAVLIVLVLALAIAGVPIGAAAAPLGIALLLVQLTMTFWAGVALLVLAAQPGAAAALGTMIAVWALLTLGVPLAAATLSDITDPAPSPVTYVDAQRRVADAIQTDRDRLVAAALRERPDLSDHLDRIPTLDHATRLSFLVPETERRLQPLKVAAEDYRQRQDTIARAIGYFAPPLGLQLALADLAGTDTARQQRFEEQARTYQRQLRAIVYPLVQAQITQPQPPATRATRGILNLPEPLTLPAFRMADQPPPSPWPFAVWLAITAAGLVLLGLNRARHWRV